MFFLLRKTGDIKVQGYPERDDAIRFPYKVYGKQSDQNRTQVDGVSNDADMDWTSPFSSRFFRLKRENFI